MWAEVQDEASPGPCGVGVLQRRRREVPDLAANDFSTVSDLNTESADDSGTAGDAVIPTRTPPRTGYGDCVACAVGWIAGWLGGMGLVACPL